MPDDNQNEWVLPSSIPFDQLNSKDLEECAYCLLDAMGGQNLEWRTGGSGQGASDGGRDLEATFYVPAADAQMASQLWWSACKGRKGTVEPDAVKSAAVKSLAKQGLMRLVIASNTQFSNPTRDWIKEWQAKHPLPVVDLWDRVTLERYLSQHPQVVLRLCSEALSPRGRARAMQSRFWNRFEYVPVKTLRDLWKDRDNVPFEGLDIFAAIVNEFAHGDITARPWGALFSGMDALRILINALETLTYLVMHASDAGGDMAPVGQATSVSDVDLAGGPSGRFFVIRCPRQGHEGQQGTANTVRGPFRAVCESEVMDAADAYGLFGLGGLEKSTTSPEPGFTRRRLKSEKSWLNSSAIFLQIISTISSRPMTKAKKAGLRPALSSALSLQPRCSIRYLTIGRLPSAAAM